MAHTARTTTLQNQAALGAGVLLARAFVFSLSPRAVLAVTALALSVAFALVAAGALATLDPQGATLRDAQAHPGHVYYHIDPENPTDAFASLRADAAPPGSLLVDWTHIHGLKVATFNVDAVDPADPDRFPELPHADSVWLGAHADAQAAQELAETWGLPEPRNASPLHYAPQDALLIPLDTYLEHFNDRTDTYRLAYLPGASPAPTSLQHASWQGIDGFFTGGAEELTTGFIGVVVGAGILAALLASGLLYLEVLARRRDLVTIRALAGEKRVRRLVAARTLLLVTVGLATGVLVALAALRIAGAALGTRLTPDPLIWLLVATSVATGALIFGTLAGIRALHRHTRTGSGTTAIPVRRYPGPVRFLLVSPRVFTGTFAATLVTTAILLTLVAVAAIPHTLFTAGDDEQETYLSGGRGNVLRGSVDRFLGENAHHLSGVTNAMGETYAPTTLDGRPLMVRGTDPDRWRDHMDVRLSEGRWPTAPHEATAGAQLASVRGISVGDLLVVPASYHHGVEAVQIVGVHRAGGLWDDQLVPGSDLAARLAGLAQDRVTGIRLLFDEPGTSWDQLRPDGVSVTRIDIDPPNPVPNTPITITVTLANFDPVAHTHPLAVHVNDLLVESTDLNVPARSLQQHTVHTSSPQADTVRVTANPTETRSVQSATLRLELPEVARPGQTTLISVRDLQNQDVAGATLRIDGETHTTTDSNGNARIQLDEPGLYNLAVTRGNDQAGALLRVAEPAWDDEARLVAERIHLHPPRTHNDTHVRLRAEATLANIGGQDHDGPINWTATAQGVPLSPANITARATSDTEVPSAERVSSTTTLTLPHGAHTLHLLGLSRDVNITAIDDAARIDPTRGDQAATIEEAIAIKRAAIAGTEPRPGDPGDAFLEPIFDRLEGAVMLVLLATLVHGAALIWVSVLRDARERQSIGVLLGHLGATSDQIRTRSVRDAALSATPGILLGLLAAWATLGLSHRFGLPAAFGHTLPIADTLGFFLRTGAVLLAIAILAALYATGTGQHRGPAASPRNELKQILGTQKPPTTHRNPTPSSRMEDS